jgi:hypothetical protein
MMYLTGCHFQNPQRREQMDSNEYKSDCCNAEYVQITDFMYVCKKCNEPCAVIRRVV